MLALSAAVIVGRRGPMAGVTIEQQLGALMPLRVLVS